MGKTIQIGVRLDEGILELVDEQATRTFRSRSDMLRKMIADWLMDRAASRTTDERVSPYEYADEQPTLREALEQERT